MAPPRAASRWWAPAIVSALSIAGAHPFCNLVFHCGCTAVGLTAHCNIHSPSPPHCPWCAHPAWFAVGALLALVFAATAMTLLWRRTTAVLPSAFVGLGAAIAGASIGALITLSTR